MTSPSLIAPSAETSFGAGEPVLPGERLGIDSIASPHRARSLRVPAARDAHEHLVEFYETEDFLIETVSGFVSPALLAGDAAIVVATATHRSAFEAALDASGIDVAEAVAAGRYLAFDAAELLATFMVDGAPDARRFRDTIGAVIESAVAGGRRVQIYGEMVALLWDAGNVPAAIALETLWNELGATHAFALLCAYPMGAFAAEASAAAFKRICEQHTTVIPSEAYSRLDDADQQQRAVARLQQEVAALRADVACLRAEREVLDQHAYVDALTGLANRRAFDRQLEREWALCARDRIDSLVLLADLDGFKAFNDRHGHAAGDEALRQFAGALRVAARGTDILGRIGGDEFGIVLVRCQQEAAHNFVVRVREAMADIARPGLQELEVSLGHASMETSTSAAGALERADLAMFAHKRAAHRRLA